MALEPDTLDGECECAEGTPAWMATFSDLATLLLTFFVLLLSFAEMDVIEFREMLGSVRQAFGVQFERHGHIEALSTTPVELNDSEEVPWNPLSTRQLGALRAIERFIRQRKMEDDADVEMTGRGIVVRLKDRLAFGVGDAALRKEAQPVLQQVLAMMKAFPSSMSIEGHTDDLPIKSRRFRSNWELSTARAIAALAYLQSLGPLPVKKVSVVGHADHQPLVPNDSPENRARNRRVEFVFAKPEFAASAETLRIAKEALKALSRLEGEDGQEAGEPKRGPVGDSPQGKPMQAPIGPVIGPQR